MNLKSIKSLLISSSAFFILSVIVFGKISQPLEFNHQIHVVDLELDCSECHRFVTKSRKATLPGKDVCMECHSEAQGDSEEEQKLISLLESDGEFNWQRVYKLAEHVYFSHFRHVTLGQIGCQKCHGEIKKLTSPPVKPAVDIADMDTCMDCHEDNQVNNDCLTCHI
jgi:hypothetical protein